jgi:hypothetical protein
LKRVRGIALHEDIVRRCSARPCRSVTQVAVSPATVLLPTCDLTSTAKHSTVMQRARRLARAASC